MLTRGWALLVVLASAVIAVSALAHPVHTSMPALAPTSLTKSVGPGGPAAVESGAAAATSAPGAASAPAGSSGGSAAQTISGTVASTSAVQIGPSGQPNYQGTEPANMTLSRAGSQLTVTIVPR